MKMKISEGYKQTDVGVIPDDWDVKKFDNLTKLITCGIAATPKYVREEIGKPFLSAQNVRNGKVIYDNYRFISHELFNQITKYSKPQKGDLLYTRVGAGIGEAGVIEDDFEFGIYVSLTLIRTEKNQLHNYFLLYLLNSPIYKSIAKNGQFAGGGVQNLNVQIVKEFSIPLPPLPEQKAIAQSLSDVDALITALERLITKKRNTKQGTMQQLLTGKKRLPGFSGEWEVKKLGDYLIKNPEYGINAPAVPYSDNLPVYIRITDISEDGRFLPEKKVSVNHTQSSNYFLENDDLVLARTGASTGKSYLYNPKDGQLVFAGFLIRVKVNHQKLDAQYLKGFLTTKPYWDWVNVMSMRSGQPGINGNEYAQLHIPLPPTLEEQKAIAQILSDMDAEIEALEQKRDKHKALKQGMMQELLTGKTRLL